MPRPQPPLAALVDSPDDAEAAFYEAMQLGDLERMMAIWADEAEVVCVHPGGESAIGLAAVRASFDAIFAQRGVPVQPQGVRRLHTADAAVHHLVERVDVPTPDGPRSAWAQATNVYVRTAQGWRMVAHHVSPGSLQPPPVTSTEAPATLH